MKGKDRKMTRVLKGIFQIRIFIGISALILFNLWPWVSKGEMGRTEALHRESVSLKPQVAPQVAPDLCENSWDDGVWRSAYYYLNTKDVIAEEFIAGQHCPMDTLHIDEIAVRILTPEDYPPYGWPDPWADPVLVGIWIDADKDSFPDEPPIFSDTVIVGSEGWAYASPRSLLPIGRDEHFWVGVQNLPGAGQEGVCIDSTTDWSEFKWAREKSIWFKQDYYPGDHMIRAYLGGNRFPSLSHPGDKEVNEGTNLTFSITALDPDDDSLSLYAENLPPGASFENGVFNWTPTFCQSGAYQVKFVVEDNGTPPLSDSVEILILVHDTNRLPYLSTQPTTQWLYGGNYAHIDITYEDLDWSECADDSLYMTLIGPGTLVDHMDGTAEYDWATTQQDTGVYTVSIVAMDRYGAADTAICEISVLPVPFELSMKDVCTYPGMEGVQFPVLLTNYSDSVAGFDILIHYDITAIDIADVMISDSVHVGSPSPDSGWYYAPSVYPPEYFQVIREPYGHLDWIRVIGIMNVDLPPNNPPIPPGVEQLLFSLVINTNPLSSGHLVRLGFRGYTCSNNTLSSPDGYTLWGPTPEFIPDWVCPERPDSLRAIALKFGSLAVHEVTIGDLNLNGIAYEIGDAVVFVNYLKFGSSALTFPEVQNPASDVNQDGIWWSISDLVMLLNKIHDIPELIQSVQPGTVRVGITVSQEDGLLMQIESDSPIAGAFFELEYEPEKVELGSVEPSRQLNGMTLESHNAQKRVRIVLYSFDRKIIPAGRRVLFTIPMSFHEEHPSPEEVLKFEEISFSDPYGNLLKVEMSEEKLTISPTPERFTIHQNSPNPFDLQTTIPFELPIPTCVTIQVYDMMGRLVRTLTDGSYPPGVHRVRWDGHDEHGAALPSGIYFYRMRAGDFEETRKMLFLRRRVQ